MTLAAYAQAVGHGAIQLWVGVFGTETPPQPAFTIDRVAMQPTVLAPLAPIRDRRTGATGRPLNHRGLYRFELASTGAPHKVEVQAGAERKVLAVPMLPAEVPSDIGRRFDILLCSCYSQPDDAGGLLGTIVSQIQVQPDLTVMAGDQVYLDLPLLENLPEAEPALSQMLGDKYLRNWCSDSLRVPGLEGVLGRAPVVTIPDDHEFWNNFPFAQKQLPNTWKPEVRGRWRDAARALYEDYQLACDAAAAGATRLDVDPLKMLFIDLRVDRDDAFDRLMNPRAREALDRWTRDLIADSAAGRPTAGLLSSGQALFITPPSEESKKRDVDAEMGNYDQFTLIRDALQTLADHGVPVIYITGDVHWGRVAGAADAVQQGRTAIYEVIASPSRLIRVPLLDTAKESANAIKGIFGKREPWPRHADPDPPPAAFGDDARFRLRCMHGHKGDQIAIVSFMRAGAGVDFQVSYYGIHADKSIAQSRTIGPFPLRQA